jgi:hypothetical protein
MVPPIADTKSTVMAFTMMPVSPRLAQATLSVALRADTTLGRREEHGEGT